MTNLEPDLELARRAARGDEAAWTEMVAGTSPRLFALLCYQVGSRQDALDLLQETYVRAFRNLDRYRGDAPLAAWLRVIALRLSIDWRRSWRRRLGRTVRLPESLPAPSAPEHDLEFDSERTALHRALIRLSEPQRAAFLLREWDGCSFREISQALGCKEATARVHHGRARAKMRALLRGSPLAAGYQWAEAP